MLDTYNPFIQKRWFAGTVTAEQLFTGVRWQISEATTRYILTTFCYGANLAPTETERHTRGAISAQTSNLRPMHALPDAEFTDRRRRLEDTPEAVLNHVELMEVMLPILRADFTIVETYRLDPGPPLP